MYDFYKEFAETLNSGQSRSVILSGNIHDLFFCGRNYVPLLQFLLEKTTGSKYVRVVFQKNGCIKVLDQEDEVSNTWNHWASANRANNDSFKSLALDGRLTVSLELLRQLVLLGRESGKFAFLIIIEAADLLFPMKDNSHLNDVEKRSLCLLQSWFSDPAFVEGRSSVCLIAESFGEIHNGITRLPQVVNIEVSSPNLEQRKHYIDQYVESHEEKPNLSLWESIQHLASYTAGLSIYAIRQLLKKSAYTKTPLDFLEVTKGVERYIKSQLGDGVVEFHKPTHRLKDCFGNRVLIKFIHDELIPRFKAEPNKAISGAAVAGPLGSGKSYIFEAMAAELDVPVLVLKQLRSQWFGQTDVIFERLRRLLYSLNKVLIFVDEADTEFGGVGENTHETERRLTGKIQAVMADSRLRGKVLWLLMTARIQLLSPDIRRPGRAGDLIIPVLDPEGEDRLDFVKWMLKDILNVKETDFLDVVNQIQLKLSPNFSAASFASLRASLLSLGKLTVTQIINVIDDYIPPAIEKVRRYQTLQAIVNCTRKSLIPAGIDREKATREILILEADGIKG